MYNRIYVYMFDDSDKLKPRNKPATFCMNNPKTHNKINLTGFKLSYISYIFALLFKMDVFQNKI